MQVDLSHKLMYLNPTLLYPLVRHRNSRSINSSSIEERFAKAINAGTNVFSGVPNLQPILNAVNQGLVTEEQSFSYIFTYGNDETRSF